MNVVETDNLTRIYGDGAARVIALDHASLHVENGEFVAVMGPSGCGKSTLLHLIGGLDRPTEGTVMIEGQELNELDDDALTDLRRKRIGFIFQFFNLIPTLSALDNTALPLVLGGLNSAEAQERASQWLSRLNVAERSSHRPEELSGGERQRIAIARALVTEPSLILADEPTGNLDSKAAADFTSLLREAVDRWERSILLVTHDDRISSYADRVLQMKDGRILNGLHNASEGEEATSRKNVNA
ncbi:MAG: ABC transporter ATP-binding protein [Anaerolineales bacterium]|jgi:putative ABC transport system ATP-binding protein